MDYDKVLWLVKNDTTIKLIRADNAPLIVGFLNFAFKQQNKITLFENELSGLLGDYLYKLNKEGGDPYPQPSREYLENWSKNGFLRRYYEGDNNEAQYDLTPAAENTLELIDGLTISKFVGTESRLLHFFSILKELVSKTNPDIDTRIDELKEQKRLIEIDNEKAEQGQIETLKETKSKERYMYAEATAKR